MAERTSHSSGVLAGALAGAVIGAAGLAWWLLSEAERRPLRRRFSRVLDLSRLPRPSQEVSLPQGPHLDSELQDKVQQLNRAIEDVRRQLESLTPEA